MDIRPGDMEAMRSKLDFIGINLYQRSIVAASPSRTGTSARGRCRGRGRARRSTGRCGRRRIYQMIKRIDERTTATR